jgi:putative tryptophan/tyrosine transport system substrate-binding protein
MKRRTFVVASGALAGLHASRALPQGSKRPRRIGILSSSSSKSSGHLVAAFKASIKSLGYVEGSNLLIDVRWADGRLERLRALASELVTLKPAVLMTSGTPGVVACQTATSSIPIVFASLGDPVGQEFIKSYSRPGGNITGVAFNEEINKKQYEVVKEVLPAATRIATMVNMENPAQKHHLDDVPQMSKALGFESIIVHATKEEELERAFEQAVKAKAQAMVVGSLAPFTGLRAQIVALQNQYRLPSFAGNEEWVPAGGIASYSFSSTENWRRAAAFVDKILKGAKPADIPVEIPTKYEIAVNLKTEGAGHRCASAIPWACGKGDRMSRKSGHMCAGLRRSIRGDDVHHSTRRRLLLALGGSAFTGMERRTFVVAGGALAGLIASSAFPAFGQERGRCVA